MIHTIVKSVIHNYILLLHGSPKHIADKLREMWSGNDFPQELKETLTVGFSNDVLTIIKSDPSIAMLADTYLDNLEKSQKYAIPGLVESGVVIAALFLLRSHIKIKKDPEGRWEFLFEHKAEISAVLDKLVDTLLKCFNKP